MPARPIDLIATGLDVLRALAGLALGIAIALIIMGGGVWSVDRVLAGAGVC